MGWYVTWTQGGHGTEQWEQERAAGGAQRTCGLDPGGGRKPRASVFLNKTFIDEFSLSNLYKMSLKTIG